MEDVQIQMDGTFRGLMPTDILGKPLISELDGSCGVGANFKRALQRFQKFTTFAIQYEAVTSAGKALNAKVYTGVDSVIASGNDDPASQNGYPASALVDPFLNQFKSNLSQGGRPCPTTPESMFIVTVIEAIAEPTKWYSVNGADTAYQKLAGGEFLQANRYMEYLQHETLRGVALTYKYDQDGCEARVNPLRFSPSGLGKGSLDHASHNGISVKGNANALPAWIPIVQSQNDGQPNTSKLLLVNDVGVRVATGAISTAPVAPADLAVVQEVTLVLSGFCVPRDVGMLMCAKRTVARARDWLTQGVYDPISGKGDMSAPA